MPRPRKLVVAACAPASHGFVSPQWEVVTARIVSGRMLDRGKVLDHVDRMLDQHLRLLNRAANAGAELAVLPEDSLRLAAMAARHRKLHRSATLIDMACVRYSQRIGDFCRRAGVYAIGGIIRHRGGRYYNTAMLLGRDGQVLACYDKTHLAKGEDRCLTPGRDLPVFDTPLGRVGLLICWDIVFPEPMGVLALRGAEVVCQPTFGHWHESDDITARCRARDWGVPLVVSMWGGCSCVIDSGGEFVARTGKVGDSLAIAALELGSPRRWLFLRDVRRDKPALRRPDLYRVLTR